MSLTEDLEQKVVSRLKDKVIDVDPTSIRGVSKIEEVYDLDLVPPPALLVMYAGEDPVDQNVMGMYVGVHTFTFDVYIMARKFSRLNDGRLDTIETPQKVGAYSLIDNVFDALAGWPALGVQKSRMRPGVVESWGVSETRVIYRSRWRFQATRTGAG